MPVESFIPDWLTFSYIIGLIEIELVRRGHRIRERGMVLFLVVAIDGGAGSWFPMLHYIVTEAAPEFFPNIRTV